MCSIELAEEIRVHWRLIVGEEVVVAVDGKRMWSSFVVES
jgi:hypothetical protein